MNILIKRALVLLIIFFSFSVYARYYDPKLSRWISVDPPLSTGEYLPDLDDKLRAPKENRIYKPEEELKGLGGVYNPVNLNGYTYTANNPVKYIDPDGNAFLLSIKPSASVLRTMGWLYKQSKTYRAMYNELGKGKGVNNIPVLVVIKSAKLNGAKGTTQTANRTLTEDCTVSVLSLDENNKLITAEKKLKKGTLVQVVEINIDESKHSAEDDFMDTIAHEIKHAAEAVRLGADKYNEMVMKNGDLTEDIAKEAANKVIHELPEKGN